MPLDQWVLSVYWQGKAFFAMQVQKSIVTQKVHIIRILFRQYLWQSRNHVSCETGPKGVRFLRQYIVKGSVCRAIFPYKTFTAN